MYVYDMPCRDLYATNVSMFEQLQCNPFYIAGKYSNMEMHFSIPIHAAIRFTLHGRVKQMWELANVKVCGNDYLKLDAATN